MTTIRAIPVPTTWKCCRSDRLSSATRQRVGKDEFVTLLNAVRVHVARAHKPAAVQANDVVPHLALLVEEVKSQGSVLLPEVAQSLAHCGALRLQPAVTSHRVAKDRRQLHPDTHAA